MELHNFKRGLNFRNDLVRASQHISSRTRTVSLSCCSNSGSSSYLPTSVSAYYGRPKADLFRGDPTYEPVYFPGRWHHPGRLRGSPAACVVHQDGKYETDLQGWITEGRGHAERAARSKTPKAMARGIPHGLCIRYMLTRQTLRYRGRVQLPCSPLICWTT